MKEVCIVFKVTRDGDYDESDFKSLIGVFTDADATEAEVHRRNARKRAALREQTAAVAAWDAAWREHGPQRFDQQESWLMHAAYNRSVGPNGPRRCIPPEAQASIDKWLTRSAAFDAKYGKRPEQTESRDEWLFAIRVPVDTWSVDVDADAAEKWRPKSTD